MSNKVSKFLSLVLRHKPEIIGVAIEIIGYAFEDKPTNKK